MFSLPSIPLASMWTRLQLHRSVHQKTSAEHSRLRSPDVVQQPFSPALVEVSGGEDGVLLQAPLQIVLVVVVVVVLVAVVVLVVAVGKKKMKLGLLAV